ncbi:MAG: hypothetical protein KME06_09660 [Kastovskya adunca ATA6-11-RM4]|jgi:hypothetical protein|nr:hypothetical protein [Kastovskya adunca ATA6-11-RM4]
MTTIAQLFQGKKVVSKARGKAIAEGIGASEPFTKNQCKEIDEIDSLMTAQSIREPGEAIKRYRAGERAVTANSKTQAYTEKINEEGAKTAEEMRQDQLALIDRSAEKQAAGLVITKNVRTAQYLATGNFHSPEVKEKVRQSERLVEACLLGNILGYDEGNLLDGFSTDARTLEGAASEKAPSSATA